MKITKQQLKQLITEEVIKALKERAPSDPTIARAARTHSRKRSPIGAKRQHAARRNAADIRYFKRTPSYYGDFPPDREQIDETDDGDDDECGALENIDCCGNCRKKCGAGPNASAAVIACAKKCLAALNAQATAPGRCAKCNGATVEECDSDAGMLGYPRWLPKAPKKKGTAGGLAKHQQRVYNDLLKKGYRKLTALPRSLREGDKLNAEQVPGGYVYLTGQRALGLRVVLFTTVWPRSTNKFVWTVKARELKNLVGYNYNDNLAPGKITAILLKGTKQ